VTSSFDGGTSAWSGGADGPLDARSLAGSVGGSKVIKIVLHGNTQVFRVTGKFAGHLWVLLVALQSISYITSMNFSTSMVDVTVSESGFGPAAS
jgi:hypothetical protein